MAKIHQKTQLIDSTNSARKESEEMVLDRTIVRKAEQLALDMVEECLRITSDLPNLGFEYLNYIQMWMSHLEFNAESEEGDATALLGNILTEHFGQKHEITAECALDKGWESGEVSILLKDDMRKWRFTCMVTPQGIEAQLVSVDDN